MATSSASSFTLCQYIKKDDADDECQEEQYSVSRLWILIQ